MAEDRVQKWRPHGAGPGVQAPGAAAASARGKKAFLLAALMLALGGAAAAWLLYVRPMVAPYVLSDRLATLVKYGVLAREPYREPGARSRSAYRLTPAGRNLVTHAFPAHAERVREAFGELDEDEKRQLAEICRKLDKAA